MDAKALDRALVLHKGSILARAVQELEAEVARLRMIERRAIEVYREPPVEPCDHVARGTAVRILGYRPNATEGEP